MKKLLDRIKSLRVYKLVYDYIDELLTRFDTDHIWIMSSGIAFNVMICIIPFTLVLLTILGLYLDSQTVQEKLISYLNSIVPLPGQYKDRFIYELTERTKELSSNAFLTGALGLSGLFWTVSGLFSAMREVLRRIYNVNTELNYFVGKLRDFVLVILSVVLFILSMAITSGFQIIQEYSQGIFGELVILTFFQKLVPFIVAFFISVSLFYVLYALVPHWKYNKRVILFSSVMSAIFFEALKYLFSVYILKIANYGRIYGAYATIVISIFYIYYISVIFVVGAELGSIYYKRNEEKFDKENKFKNIK